MAGLLLLLPLFFLISTNIPSSAAADANTLIYAGCSQPKYIQGSAYQLNVDSLLSSLANAAGGAPFAKFTSSNASPSTPVYGLFQCRGDVTGSTCSSCIRSALSQLSPLCPSAAGAALQLDGCFIRYGNDSFLGKQDINVLYKKCGPVPNGGYDAELMAMRDDALQAIVVGGGTGGTYRVGASGSVQAAAQCTGDLTGKDCGDCVATAIGQLKGACGYAASGELYLGKCFAKYYSSGQYNQYSYNPHNSGSSSGSSSGGDDAGKTLAIIIGLMAGVALIIVFLSFIRRAGNSKH